MKKITIILMAVLVALTPIYGQTKKQTREARKEASVAAKKLKRDGYASIELGDVEKKLEGYFLKVHAGCPQVSGFSEGCISVNLAKLTALNNAANEYATISGGAVRGRIASSASNIDGQQVDNIVAAYERLMMKEIRGELSPYVIAIKKSHKSYSARAYCIIDIDNARMIRLRALETALEEQKLAGEYGSRVSDWIEEGFAGKEAGTEE